MSIWLPAKEFLMRSSVRVTSWVSHERLDQNSEYDQEIPQSQTANKPML